MPQKGRMANYILRNIDPALWAAVQARLEKDNAKLPAGATLSLRALFLTFLQAYAAGKFNVLKP